MRPTGSMMRAMGMSDADIDAPFVGVASTHNEVTPCNAGIKPLVDEIKVGVRASGGSPFEFGTITVSDAISMGTEGMRGSLISREIIADSIETVCFAERYDGLVAAAGCDKSLPGAMMAMARLDIPSVFVYGGSILPGHWKGEDIQIQTVFEAVGQDSSPVQIDEDELYGIETNACPGPRVLRRHVHSEHNVLYRRGSRTLHPRCGIGTERRSAQASVIARSRCIAVMNLLRKGIYPRHILSREAFENAVTLVVAMGGSTNTALHLPAIAHEAGIELTLEDIHAISMRTPAHRRHEAGAENTSCST